MFQAWLLAHQEEGRLFGEIVSRPVEAGLQSKRAVHGWTARRCWGGGGAGHVHADPDRAAQAGQRHRPELPAELMARLKRYLQTGKADIDWEDRVARRRELQQLVADAELALSELPVETDKLAASAARALLERAAGQAVEPDRTGELKIREGVAKDRVISTVDPEMRHGHKSSAGRWDGYRST